MYLVLFFDVSSANVKHIWMLHWISSTLMITVEMSQA